MEFHGKDKFQVMPGLRPEEYEKLKESIAERGVLVPVEKDADTGEILDGFHRMRACEELGIEPPIVERHFKDDAERKIHALTLNLARRQLGQASWGKAFETLLEVRGVKTTRGPKEREGNSATVAEIAKEAGVSERTARNRMKLARDLEDHPEIAEQVDRGEITPMEGRRRVGAAPPKEKRSGPPIRRASDGEPTMEEWLERGGVTMADAPRRSEEEKALYPTWQAILKVGDPMTERLADVIPEAKQFAQLEADAITARDRLSVLIGKLRRKGKDRLRAVE